MPDLLWAGKSELDHETNILLLATGRRRRTENTKTGDMIQTWILHADKAPGAAWFDNDTASICGDCIFQRFMEGGCYVNVHRAPRVVWKAWREGRYESFIGRNLMEYPQGVPIRLGSYGDPAAVPYSILGALASSAPFHTGYTHQWRTCPAVYRNALMASCDSPDDIAQAQALGYRTFTVSSTKPAPGHVLCPASKEAGKKLTCAECKACDGNATARRSNIYIPRH